MIEYTIDAAMAAERVDKVVLTTDDPQIASVASSYDMWVVDRPAELASDTATTDAAARYGADQAYEQYGFLADVIVMLYGNIPIRPAGLIDMAVEQLLTQGGDSVQSYSPVGKMHPDWMVTLDDDRVVLNCEKAIYRRQDLRPMFIPNGAVIAATRESFYRAMRHAEDFHAFLGTDRRGFVHPQSHLIVDIDEERDMFLAEAVLRSIQERTDDPAARASAVV